MNDAQRGESSVNDKKIWTQPVIQAIQLNGAQHQTLKGRDGGGAHTKS